MSNGVLNNPHTSHLKYVKCAIYCACLCTHTSHAINSGKLIVIKNLSKAGVNGATVQVPIGTDSTRVIVAIIIQILSKERNEVKQEKNSKNKNLNLEKAHTYVFNTA